MTPSKHGRKQAREVQEYLVHFALFKYLLHVLFAVLQRCAKPNIGIAIVEMLYALYAAKANNYGLVIYFITSCTHTHAHRHVIISSFLVYSSRSISQRIVGHFSFLSLRSRRFVENRAHATEN